MIYEFNNEIYPLKLWITFDATQDELAKYFLDNCIPEVINRHTSFGTTSRILGRRETRDAGVLIQISNKKITSGPIAHEAVHAAIEIANSIGEQIIYENQEWFAYLVQWIVNKVLEVKTQCKTKTLLMLESNS